MLSVPRGEKRIWLNAVLHSYCKCLIMEVKLVVILHAVLTINRWFLGHKTCLVHTCLIARLDMMSQSEALYCSNANKWLTETEQWKVYWPIVGIKWRSDQFLDPSMKSVTNPNMDKFINESQQWKQWICVSDLNANIPCGGEDRTCSFWNGEGMLKCLVDFEKSSSECLSEVFYTCARVTLLLFIYYYSVH